MNEWLRSMTHDQLPVTVGLSTRRVRFIRISFPASFRKVSGSSQVPAPDDGHLLPSSTLKDERHHKDVYLLSGTLHFISTFRRIGRVIILAPVSAFASASALIQVNVFRQGGIIHLTISLFLHLPT